MRKPSNLAALLAGALFLALIPCASAAAQARAERCSFVSLECWPGIRSARVPARRE